jgi:prepilin-type N-terminal cleavage/methylation domain-containing protein
MRPDPRSSQSGFSLVEMLIALALLALALTLSAELLMESAQLLSDSAAEQRDAPVPLILARIRGDVLGADRALMSRAEDGSLLRVLLPGHPEGLVQYEKIGGSLTRSVLDLDGTVREESVLWPGVTGWECRAEPPGGRLVRFEVAFRRRSSRRSPLPVVPALRGPAEEDRREVLFLLPRGNGLGRTW